MNNYGGENPYYGGAGGGYVAGGSPYGSQDSPSRKARVGNQTIRPVTIKQVHEASQVHPDADFTIDGIEVAQILMVGSVRNASQSATNVMYEIGDGTGYIDCRVWLEQADDESGKTAGIEQDIYVGIMGTIKMYNGQRHISATHIRPINDPNEVQHHLLKSLYVTLTLRGAVPGQSSVAKASTSADYSTSTNNAAQNNDQYSHLEPLQRKLIAVIAAEIGNSPEGVHVATIARSCENASNEEITDALDWLSENGFLYSTLDDHHYSIAN